MARGRSGSCLRVGRNGQRRSSSGRRHRGNSGHYPQRDFARFLTTFAQSEGLKYGYASYWVASALTWETKTRLEVYPVLPCSAPHGFCTYRYT